jgi:predicted  nucleic acid-binding Zn-ribbon protein
MALDDKQEKELREQFAELEKRAKAQELELAKAKKGTSGEEREELEEEEEGAEKDAKAADKARQRVHDIRGASEDSVHALMEIAQRIEKRLDKRQESIWEWFFGPDEEEEKA